MSNSSTLRESCSLVTSSRWSELPRRDRGRLRNGQNPNKEPAPDTLASRFTQCRRIRHTMLALKHESLKSMSCIIETHSFAWLILHYEIWASEFRVLKRECQWILVFCKMCIHGPVPGRDYDCANMKFHESSFFAACVWHGPVPGRHHFSEIWGQRSCYRPGSLILQLSGEVIR